MTKEQDTDFNVIILPSYENDIEEMIRSCLDILDTCKDRIEREAVVRMIVSDTRMYTLRDVCSKKIQMLAQVLKETEDNSKW